MSETQEIPEEIHIQQKEAIKLIRNSKGYTWEIKILEINPERIEDINNQMLTKFGGAQE